jgi:hypothetical protein
MILRITLTLAFLSFPAFAQETTSSTKATVYIYKTWHAATLWRAAFAVYLDDKMIARLDRGIYLVAQVSPGKHSFSTKDKKSGGVELDIKAGETYILRLETDSGGQVTHPRLNIPAPEQTRFDLKQMKPIEKKDIKDASVVLFPVPAIPK